MIPSEYPASQGRSQRNNEQVADRGRRGAARGYQPWVSRIGILVLLVFIGVICIGLLDSNRIKTRFLVGVANTYPDSARAYSFLKRHYSTPSQSANTVAACEGLVKLKPEDSGAHVLLGNAYIDAGRLQEATASFKEAIALDPNCFDAHLGMGRTHFERGAYSDAVDSYQRALRIRPGSADAQLSLGIALSSSGRYDEAMQAFKRAKELDPQVTETQVLTGRAYLRAGMYTQAIECLKDVVQIDQRHAQAYYNLGRAYLRVGDRDLALEQQHILRRPQSASGRSIAVADPAVVSGPDFALSSSSRSRLMRGAAYVPQSTRTPRDNPGVVERRHRNHFNRLRPSIPCSAAGHRIAACGGSRSTSHRPREGIPPAAARAFRDVFPGRVLAVSWYN